MASPPPGFSNPRSHRGTRTDWSAWMNRRKENVCDAAKFIGEVAEHVHARHQLMQEHRDVTRGDRQEMRETELLRAKHSQAYIVKHSELKKKTGLRGYLSAQKEIMREIKNEGEVIKARYHNATADKHAWNPFHWSGLIQARMDYTRDITRHKIKLVAAHVWTPGVGDRVDMYRHQLLVLAHQNVRRTNAHNDKIAAHKEVIDQSRAQVDAQRPSLFKIARAFYQHARSPSGSGTA